MVTRLNFTHEFNSEVKQNQTNLGNAAFYFGMDNQQKLLSSLPLFLSQEENEEISGSIVWVHLRSAHFVKITENPPTHKQTNIDMHAQVTGDEMYWCLTLPFKWLKIRWKVIKQIQQNVNKLQNQGSMGIYGVTLYNFLHV